VQRTRLGKRVRRPLRECRTTGEVAYSQTSQLTKLTEGLSGGVQVLEWGGVGGLLHQIKNAFDLTPGGKAEKGIKVLEGIRN